MHAPRPPGARVPEPLRRALKYYCVESASRRSPRRRWRTAWSAWRGQAPTTDVRRPPDNIATGESPRPACCSLPRARSPASYGEGGRL